MHTYCAYTRPHMPTTTYTHVPPLGYSHIYALPQFELIYFSLANPLSPPELDENLRSHGVYIALLLHWSSNSPKS